MVLLDTGTPGTSGEIYSEDADGETRTRSQVIFRADYKYHSFSGYIQSRI